MDKWVDGWMNNQTDRWMAGLGRMDTQTDTRLTWAHRGPGGGPSDATVEPQRRSGGSAPGPAPAEDGSEAAFTQHK